MAEIIVQAGYMSGDMFGVAAALKLQPDLYVLIVHDDKDVSNANKMYELYLSSVKNFATRTATVPALIGRREGQAQTDTVVVRDRSAGMTSTRVKLLKVDNSKTFYKSMHVKAGSTTPKDAALKLLKPGNFLKVKSQFAFAQPGMIRALGASTKTVIYHFNNSDKVITRRALIQQWEIDDFDELALQRFLTRHGVTYGRKYLFLWIRQSGSTGGAHPELDAGVTGWQQIINGLPDEIVPVIIGDQFLTGPALTWKHGRLIDLTKFWEDIPFSMYKNPKFKGAEARLSQFALFDYMTRAGYKVAHLGMRSGVLESVALMGATVTYMEEVNNPQADRIKNLANSLGNLQQGTLGALPTQVGKVMNRNENADWSVQYRPAVQKIANHCGETVPVIAARIRAVEKQNLPGCGLGRYQDAFIAQSEPDWKLKPSYRYTDWAQYQATNKKWCDGLKARISELYDATYSTAGVLDGFAGTDLSNIINHIKTRF